MWIDAGLALMLLRLLSKVLESACLSPPGKPVLVRCRSPEKETFTCWWQPGSTGGLPTTYRLYYQKNDLGVNECPDYQTAGNNSCFFDKNYTFVWVVYNITVMATNALGMSLSDPVDVDVMNIVQPYSPENVTVMLVETGETSPHLLVKWEPPHQVDTRSGWMTLVYEIRTKREKEEQEEWEVSAAGKQMHFNIYSLHSGEVYMAQVRCKPDHGSWSEWSPTVLQGIPNYTEDMSVWIVVVPLSAFTLLVVMGIVATHNKNIKNYFLPHVPGPKITGFDTQLLKGGRSVDLFCNLINQGFPPTLYTEDLPVEYLVVFDSEENLTSDYQNCHMLDHRVRDRESLKRHKSWDNVLNLDSTSSKIKTSSSVETSYLWVKAASCDTVHEPLKQESASSRRPPSTRLPKLQLNSKLCIDSPENPSKDNINQRSENTGIPFKLTDYVDVQKATHSKMQENKLTVADQQDYSQVSGSHNDNILLLKKRVTLLNDKLKGTQAEKGSEQKTRCHMKPPTTKEELLGGSQGYVETLTSPSS